MLSCALACVLAAHAAAPGNAQGSQVREYRIPAGPLGSVLARLASESGLLLAADARLTQGRSSAGLDGRYDARQAFETLLAGTGLELVAQAEGYGLRASATAGPAPARSGPAGDAVLPTIRVRPAPEATTDAYRTDLSRTATHTPTRLQDLPQSIHVVTRAQIDDMALQTMADVERFLPGVGSAQGEGNRDTPVFRGNLSTADFLVDGLRDDVAYYRDTYNVARVESLNGPNAMSIGAGSAGGAINRVGKTPEDAPRLDVRLQGDGWAQRRATVDWEPAADPGPDPGPGLRVNAMHEDSGGYRDGFYLHRSGFNPVLAWRREATRVTLGAEYFRDARLADRGIPSYQGRPVHTSASTFFGNPDQSRSDVGMGALDLDVDVEHALGRGSSVHGQARLADYRKFFSNVFPGAVTPADGDALQVALYAHDSLARRRNLDGRVEVTVPVRQGTLDHRVLAGVELGLHAGESWRDSGFFGADAQASSMQVPLAAPTSHAPATFRHTPTDVDNDSRSSNVGAYLQDQVQLSPRWSAVLGMRHDKLDIRMNDRRPVAPAATLASHDAPWSPRVAALFAPTPELSLYAGYSIGYVPRAGDQLAALTPANAALAPERFGNREAGAKWSVTPGLDATAAVYVMDRRNVAVAATDSPDDLVLAQGQRSRGLELGLRGELSPRWRVVAAYALQDSRLRSTLSALAQDGARMPHVPRHALSVWARGQLDARWSAGVGLACRSSMYTSTDDLVRLPGYARVDAGRFFQASRAVQVQVNVENLRDRRYAAFAQSDNNITPGSPRAWRLTLDVRR